MKIPTIKDSPGVFNSTTLRQKLSLTTTKKMSTQRLTSSGGGGNNHAIQSYYSTEASPYDPSQFQNDEANLTELTHDDNDKSKQSKFKESILLYVATVVMVLARSVDFVLYVRMTKKMRNYE